MRRNSVFMAGMAALLLAFGLVLAGCDNGNGNGDGIITVSYLIYSRAGVDITVIFEAPTAAEVESAAAALFLGVILPYPAKPIVTVPDSVTIPVIDQDAGEFDDKTVTFTLPAEDGYYFAKLSVNGVSKVYAIGSYYEGKVSKRGDFRSAEWNGEVLRQR
jgi:hypothetical protein